MKRVILSTLFALLVFVPKANAITFDPIDSGRQISSEDTAELYCINGALWMHETFGIFTDAGEIGPAFVLFDLSTLQSQVISGTLILVIRRASHRFPMSIALYDVIDIEALLYASDWDSINDCLEDFWQVKDDLNSGEVYGNFTLSVDECEPPTCFCDIAMNCELYDIYVEVPLTQIAISDINAAAGNFFAMGLGEGSLVLEGTGIVFESAELILNLEQKNGGGGGGSSNV